MRIKNLELQEMVRFSKGISDWILIESTRKMPYSLNGSLKGLDVYMHLGHGAIMPFFQIGIFNGKQVVGSEVCCISEGSPPEVKILVDYYGRIRESCSTLGRSHLPEPRYLKIHEGEDIERVRRTIGWHIKKKNMKERLSE